MALPDNINNEDRELLSAYLDDELSSVDRQMVEMRLSQQPVLQSELDSLRAVKLAVQGLPMLKAPRDFTLTAEMLPPQPTPAWLRVVTGKAFSAVSAAAATFLISVGLFLLLTSGTASENMAASAPMPESEPEIASIPTQANLSAASGPTTATSTAGDNFSLDADGESANDAAEAQQFEELEADQPQRLEAGTEARSEAAPPMDDMADDGAVEESAAEVAETEVEATAEERDEGLVQTEGATLREVPPPAVTAPTLPQAVPRAVPAQAATDDEWIAFLLIALGTILMGLAATTTLTRRRRRGAS